MTVELPGDALEIVVVAEVLVHSVRKQPGGILDVVYAVVKDVVDAGELDAFRDPISQLEIEQILDLKRAKILVPIPDVFVFSGQNVGPQIVGTVQGERWNPSLDGCQQVASDGVEGGRGPFELRPRIAREFRAAGCWQQSSRDGSQQDPERQDPQRPPTLRAERVWTETFRGEEVHHSEAKRNIPSASAARGFVSVPIIDEESSPGEA
jgi:hypothetical protein